MAKKIWVFRIPEGVACRLFEAGEGTLLGDDILGYDTREVHVSEEDSRLDEIELLNRESKRTCGRNVFGFWELTHAYSKRELELATSFELTVTAVFEPTGADCGTTYDYLNVCPECGCGVTQSSDLRLDLRKVPKTRDIAMTLARSEWIVSQRLAGLLVDGELTGFDLAPVRHKGSYENEPMDFRAVRSGRELVRRAEQAGCAEGTPAFWNWLNRAEQRELSNQMVQEWADMRSERGRRLRTPLPVWYQLVITARPVSTVPPTRYGIDPFDSDPSGQYRCSRLEWDAQNQHVAGCNLLSELYIDGNSYDGSDITCTRQCVGWPARLVRQVGGEHGSGTPHLIVSPRFRKVLIDNKIRGWNTDVAYLV